MLPARPCAREHQALPWAGAAAAGVGDHFRNLSPTDLAQKQEYPWMAAVPGWLEQLQHRTTLLPLRYGNPTTADAVAC